MVYKEISILLKRSVDVEGEGLILKEFLVSLKGKAPFKMNEKMFLRKDLVDNPVAISLEHHILKPGETVRVFVVEQRPERAKERPRDVSMSDLPIMSNKKVDASISPVAVAADKTVTKGGQDEE